MLALNTLVNLLLHDPAIRVMVVVPLALILLDVLSGIGSAIRHGDFLLAQIADFAGKDLQKWLAIMAVFAFAVVAGTSYTAEAVALGAPMLALTGALVASITENVAEMLGMPFAEFGSLVQNFITWLKNLGMKTPAVESPTPPNVVSFSANSSASSQVSDAPYASPVTPQEPDNPAA